MKFVLDFDIPKSELALKHGDGIVLQGSCFSDEILTKLKAAGHTVSANHFGTVFHPSMLAFNVLNLFESEVEERLLQRDDLFFSWDASSTVFGYSQEGLVDALVEKRKNLLNELKSARMLVVTFGTAWGYELIETESLVANCHKIPASNFQKFLSSPYEMTQDWVQTIEKLTQFNPDLQIVFTVSPVRHIKDGLVENNLSKARLIEVVQQLALEPNCHYFPSYELMMDVLRDYRFYKSDLIHPNELAVNYIWGRFQETYFSDESLAIGREIMKLRAAEQHSSLFVQSRAHQQQVESTKAKIEDFLAKHKKVVW